MPHRNREPRRPVRLGVRLKDNSGWSDAQILNVSSRGVMVTCPHPPRRGTYVELRHGAYVIIGRVAWNAPGRFGVQVQERIVIDDLLRPGPSGARARRAPAACQLRVRQRRRPSLPECHAQSARFARSFDFVATAIAAAGLTLLASTAAANALGEPLAAAQEALRGREPRQ